MREYSLSRLSDSVLLRDYAEHRARRHRDTAVELAYLGEIDARRLYRPAAYESMYEYCIRELHFSEDSAYKHIRAARLARTYPAVLRAVAEGRLHLSAVVMLASHLTTGNAEELIAAATHRTKAEIEQLLAARFPRPDLPERIALVSSLPATMKEVHGELAPGPVGMTMSEQKLELSAGTAQPLSMSSELELSARTVDAAAQAPAAQELATRTVPAPEPRPRIAPLAPERFALQCTVSRATHDKLCRAKALLGHGVASGDLAQVLDRALDALLRELEKRKFAATERPQRVRALRAGSTAANPRHIPAAVKRAVWRRDGGRCTFVGEHGRRCEARSGLEFDHEVPVARDGRATAGNLRLRCRAHNQLEAERTYGAEFMRHKRGAALEQAAKRARTTKERGKMAAEPARQARTPEPAAEGHRAASPGY